MAITANDVKELRERTGAGMMDCKRALTEADGNMDKAIEILREKGLAAAAKKSGRIAAEGLVASYIHMGGRIGVLVEVNCETDFVAKTDNFKDLVHDVAMQIAAMSPKYWDKAQVPQADVDKELAVQVALMDNDPKMASKPAAVKEKIAAGKMAAFYKESCLLQQEFVRADLFKGDVAGYIADAAKKLGGKVTFVDAIHYIKGEGIEKKEEDFAAEVAAQIAGAAK